MVGQGRIELPTLGFSGKTLEFHNLLKSIQLIDMEDISFLTPFPILVNCGIFWKDFLTRILTWGNA
jgi:hypothetical protein